MCAHRSGGRVRQRERERKGKKNLLSSKSTINVISSFACELRRRCAIVGQSHCLLAFVEPFITTVIIEDVVLLVIALDFVEGDE